MSEPVRTLETRAGARFELHPFDGGHERVFPGAWSWHDAVPWTEDEIAAKVKAGEWREARAKETRR